jgi:sulfur-oxidizing protein SoxY
MEDTKRVGFTRRALLTAAVAGGAGFAGPTLVSPLNVNVSDDEVELIKRLTGKIPPESDRLHIAMPRVFPNGYTVPLSLEAND